MKQIAITLLLVLPIVTFSQRIAITIDDLPFGYSGGMTDKEKVEAFKQIVSAAKKYKAPVTGFVTSGNMTTENSSILDLAVKAGFQLGNHTHRHFDLNRVSAATYMSDIDSCEQLAGDWIDSNYFRYSMLHRGDIRSKRDSVFEHLATKKYIIAPVTIDNNEWVYNRGFSLARRINNSEEMNKIGKEYLYHMQEVTARYQKLSLQIAGREIPHILLLHANPINAEYLDDLLGWYKKNGWEFITLDEALKDEFYEIKDDYVGPYGFSQLDRIKKAGIRN